MPKLICALAETCFHCSQTCVLAISCKILVLDIKPSGLVALPTWDLDLIRISVFLFWISFFNDPLHLLKLCKTLEHRSVISFLLCK